MDKAIATTLLIVVSMILAVTLFNVAYPAAVQAGEAIQSMASRSQERMRSEIALVHVAAESGAADWWEDNGTFDVIGWIKNVGSNRITAIERADLFFGPEGNFARIPHEDVAGGAFPYWTYTVENADDWSPTATLSVSIHSTSALAPGRYFFKFVAPNGLAVDTVVGL